MFRIYNFIILLLLLSNFVKSQNLPNYEFEEWVDETYYINPKDWGTSNFSLYSVYIFNPVKKEEVDVYTGTNSIKLETIQKNIAGEDVKVAGVITLGTFDIDLSTRKAVINGGIPFNKKPTVFSGYYKYSTTGIDSCIMGIYLTKFNSNKNIADTIATGIFTSGNQSNWTKFEVPISYSSSENPDTMNIVILSSDTSIFEPGSKLLIDDLYIDATLNSKLIHSVIPEIKIFPNPTKDYLKISCSTNETCKYSIIDITGKSILESDNHNIDEYINVTELKPGIYFIKISIENYKPTSKSFIIK